MGFGVGGLQGTPNVFYVAFMNDCASESYQTAVYSVPYVVSQVKDSAQQEQRVFWKW